MIGKTKRGKKMSEGAEFHSVLVVKMRNEIPALLKDDGLLFLVLIRKAIHKGHCSNIVPANAA